MWEIDAYRKVSPGYLCCDLFFNYFKRDLISGASITDFGAGTGSVVWPFLERKLKVQLIDIAPNALDEGVRNLMAFMPDQVVFHQECLWNLSHAVTATDWAYCCDVMEHIPEEKVDAVLAEISEKTRKGGFFQICLQDEYFGDMINEKLHLSVHNHKWWEEKLSEFFPVYATLSLIDGARSGFLVGPGYRYSAEHVKPDTNSRIST